MSKCVKISIAILLVCLIGVALAFIVIASSGGSEEQKGNKTIMKEISMINFSWNYVAKKCLDIDNKIDTNLSTMQESTWRYHVSNLFEYYAKQVSANSQKKNNASCNLNIFYKNHMK